MTEQEWDEKEKELEDEIAIINKLEQRLKHKSNPIAQRDLWDRCMKVEMILYRLGLQIEAIKYSRKSKIAFDSYVSSDLQKEAHRMAYVEDLEEIIPVGQLSTVWNELPPEQVTAYAERLKKEKQEKFEIELRNEIKVINQLEQRLKNKFNPLAQYDLAEKYKKAIKLLNELGRLNEASEFSRKYDTAFQAYLDSDLFEEAYLMTL